MQSIFRIYAKTTKQNDKYLYNELITMGLQPKYEELLHAFYFNANFQQIFKLSFQGFTVESLYVQLGHRYPLSTQTGQNEKSVNQFLRKINFRSYLPLQRGIIENTTLKLLIRESSSHLPSENAIISIFQNYLQKQIVLKQYRKMLDGNGNRDRDGRLENYYDIKQIVERKWEFEDQYRQEKMNLLIQAKGKEKEKENKKLMGRSRREEKQVQQYQEQEEERKNQLAHLFNVPYNPHFLMYIRRNHARLLLKLNKQSMHKFGWKKNIGWGPIRQTLTASILYRTGLLQNNKNTPNKEITLWDPFCGSGTIPLVTLSMLKSLKIRKDYKENFIWNKWPVYKEEYLAQYMAKSRENGKEKRVNLLCSDIDIAAVRNCVGNFREFIEKNKEDLELQANGSEAIDNFVKLNPSDQIFQILPNTIYIGCGDFQHLAEKLLHNQQKKVTILTNLPYLGQRSKQHHPLNQLHSIYRRFGTMLQKYKTYINNVFIIVDADIHNSNHFVRVSGVEWRILEHFSNGGIEICLLGWSGNVDGWGDVVGYEGKSDKGVTAYEEAKAKHLQQYRTEIKALQTKRYSLPIHMAAKKGLKKNKRVLEKKKARHLLAAYKIFAKRRDQNQTFERYARKNLALRLSVRGKTWKRKNISLIGKQLEGKQEIIKKQFENRIEQALKRSQQMKMRKKGLEAKPKRKW